MTKRQQVIALLALRWSFRRIERETGVRRETISRYSRLGDPNAAKVFPGEEGPRGPETGPEDGEDVGLEPGGVKQATISAIKELKDFDWAFNPKIPKTRIVELACGRFVAQRDDVLLIGPPGLGKSHIVTAIAIGAIRAGYRALVRSAFDLSQDFAEAEALSQRKELVQNLTKVDVLIIEDFGMKRLGSSAAEDLLEVFVRRHETASTIVTTNRPTEDWGAFLGDVPAATAILDRFLSRAQIIKLQGKSYRLHQQRLKHSEQVSA